MTSPQVSEAAASTRTEQEARETKLRDLYWAKIKAWDAYSSYGSTNTQGKSEDERIDIEIENARLRNVWETAAIAVMVSLAHAIRQGAAPQPSEPVIA